MSEQAQNRDQLSLFGLEKVAQRTPYKILSEYRKVNGEFVSGPKMREKYVHQTDDLIWQLEGGGKHRVVDCAIYLDKSARPVEWLTSELWPLVNPDKPFPEARFLNIDREQWRPYLGAAERSGFEEPFDFDKIPKHIYGSLRSVFVTHPEQVDSQDIWQMPTYLDDKEVLVVDEVRSTGHTLDIALEMMRRAVPEAHVRGAHWMIPELIHKPGSGRMNNEVPVWYSSTNVRGRGVGDRDTKISSQSMSKRQRLGSWFLSTRLSEPDERSLQLRHEMHQLAEDVREHRTLYLPSLDRDIDDADRIIERVNDMSINEFAAKRRNVK